MSPAKKPTGWKVVALALTGATIFWFFSALGKNYTHKISHPISFVFDRDSLVAIYELPSQVELEVSGGGWDLFRQNFWFGADPVYFFLENPTSTKTLENQEILKTFSEQLNQFQVNYIVTDSLALDINVRKSREVVLKLDVDRLLLSENYRIVSDILIDPDTVILNGPDSFIDTLKMEYLLQLDFDDINKSFDKDVKLNVPERPGIFSEPKSVNVRFEVDRFEQLEIPIRVDALNFPLDSSAYLNSTDALINFTVQRSLIEDYSAEDFKVVVDYKLMNKKDSLAPALIVFYPENITRVIAEPDTFKIKFIGK